MRDAPSFLFKADIKRLQNSAHLKQLDQIINTDTSNHQQQPKEKSVHTGIIQPAADGTSQSTAHNASDNHNYQYRPFEIGNSVAY